MTATLGDAVLAALDRVVDPCSVGRGVPAGLRTMGMVARVETDEAARSVSVTLKLTSPACHFQWWFSERVRDEVLSIPRVAKCSVSFSKDFDWSDEAMSPDLRARLSRRVRQQGAASPALVPHEKEIQAMPIGTQGLPQRPTRAKRGIA